MFGSLSSALDTLLALQEAVDQAKDADFFGAGTASRGVFPAINIFEKEDDLVLVAELPGVDKKNLILEVKDDILRLAGEREIVYDKNISCHRLERKPMKFDRSVRLRNKIDDEKIQAEYQNGLLVVILPRKESDKPKHIAIN